MIFWYRPWRREQDREDVQSTDGTITFNRLQQRETDTSEEVPTPVEQYGTTDPLGLTDG